MAPKKRNPPIENASTETAAAAKTRSLNSGTIVGRAADRLLELEVEERVALARSPEAIKEGFAKKREEALSKLTETQRKGALAMVEAMRPVAEDAKAAAE